MIGLTHTHTLKPNTHACAPALNTQTTKIKRISIDQSWKPECRIPSKLNGPFFLVLRHPQEIYVSMAPSTQKSTQLVNKKWAVLSIQVNFNIFMFFSLWENINVTFSNALLDNPTAHLSLRTIRFFYVILTRCICLLHLDFCLEKKTTSKNLYSFIELL